MNAATIWMGKVSGIMPASVWHCMLGTIILDHTIVNVSIIYYTLDILLQASPKVQHDSIIIIIIEWCLLSIVYESLLNLKRTNNIDKLRACQYETLISTSFVFSPLCYNILKRCYQLYSLADQLKQCGFHVLANIHWKFHIILRIWVNHCWYKCMGL